MPSLSVKPETSKSLDVLDIPMKRSGGVGFSLIVLAQMNSLVETGRRKKQPPILRCVPKITGSFQNKMAM